MKIVSSKEMREVDRYTIEDIGIPGIVLMENAAKAVVDAIMENYNPSNAVICCGIGNNGGDGFAIARLLHEKSIPLAVILIGDKNKIKGDALINFNILHQLGIRVIEITTADQIDDLQRVCIDCDMIIDALFGTGLSRNIEGLYLDVVRRINELDKEVVAVDIPSGIDADSGKIYGAAIKAKLTVTLCSPKVGLLLYPGAEYVGKLITKDIGIPRKSIERIATNVQILTDKEAKALLPKRTDDSHKGTFGKLLLIAGSANMPGAAVLSSNAAYRSGVGLVQVFCEEVIKQTIIQQVPEAILDSFSAEQDKLTNDEQERLLQALEWADTVAIGPGLGQNNITLALLSQVLEVYNKTIVIDADGLNVLSKATSLLKKTMSNIIITPHLGEMARLCNTSIAQVKNNLIEISKTLSQTYHVISVVKSARTIITFPNGDVHINLYGNAGMATAGSGDVLTGIISSLICQGVSLENAVLLGVYLHSKAGDLARDQLGEHGLIARDIIDKIPYVMKQSLIE